MAQHFGLEFKKYLLDREIGENEYFKFAGCSDEDIEQARIAQDVAFLPRIYREFLLTMGHGAGVFLIGSDYTYHRLLSMKESAQAILELSECKDTLPDDAFVFFMHQGYAFWYFPTANNDEDPPVFGYREEDPEVKILSDHLSTWFYKVVDLHNAKR